MKKSMFIVYVVIVFSAICAYVSCDQQENDHHVIMIGDSIFDLSEKATFALVKKTGEVYRQRYQNGAGILRENKLLRPDTIPEQYEIEKNNNPVINTVIMNGGANDVSNKAVISCRAQSKDDLSDECHDFLDDVVAEFDILLKKMHQDNVRNVIFLKQYNFLKPSGLINIYGNWFNANAALDHLMPRLEEKCISANVSCFPVDTQSIFLGNEKKYILKDGIHPSDEGSEIIADLIFETMCKNDIEINSEIAEKNCRLSTE